MGLQDFTGNSNIGNPPNGGSSSGGPSAPSLPNLGASSDIEDMLINYNNQFATADPALFRDGCIDQTLATLISKNKPNALLVGPAGTGKTKIVEEIARRIAIGDDSVPDALADSVICEIPLSTIVAGTSFVGQLEERMVDLINYVENPQNHIILFIDEIHQLVSGGDKSYEKIAQILKPAMARGRMRLIGATTTQEAKHFMDDPAFNRRWSTIYVDELTRDQTEVILEKASKGFTAHYKRVTIDQDVIHLTALIADQYSAAGNHRPDTALTLLDRACADAVIQRKKQEIALASNPTLASALPYNINITENALKKTAMKIATGQSQKITFDKQDTLDKLSSIKGQDEVIDELTTVLANDSRGLFPRTRPLTFLFAGKSGVGKTQVTKILAHEITGQKPIVLNMTEYNDPASINRIIGSAAGYVGYDDNNELPFDALESNPYQIILLDEFEKAHRSVQRLFMRAFDEGTITTSRGSTIDFTKAIIIATTNASHSAGSSKQIGFGNTKETKATNLAVIDQLKQFFDAELINRFTHIYTFNAISKDVYKSILAETYAKEIARIIEEHPSIKAPTELDDATLDTLANDTYVPDFGARPAEKTIREYIETHV